MQYKQRGRFVLAIYQDIRKYRRSHRRRGEKAVGYEAAITLSIRSIKTPISFPFSSNFERMRGVKWFDEMTFRPSNENEALRNLFFRIGMVGIERVFLLTADRIPVIMSRGLKNESSFASISMGPLIFFSKRSSFHANQYCSKKCPVRSR